MTSPTLAATAQWTTTGDLPSAGSWYGQYEGAILLKNNKVLVAGGADGKAVALTKAAVYDAASGKWTATAPLQTPRRLHTATLLDDGKVLVAGGTSGSSPLSPGLATAELYDPAAGTWKTVAGMHEPRFGHSAVLLPNKKVLVAGGTTVRSGDSVRALRSAELYDPAADKWTDAAAMTDARSGHPAVVLKGGRVLVCGGTAAISGHDEAALAFCELYNPDTDTWAPTGDLAEPRSRHQATQMSDTTVLVIGGSTPGTPGDGTFDPFSHLTAEVYDQATGAWTAMPARPGGRGFHRAVPLGSGKVLVIGGTADINNDVGYQSVLIFDSAAKTWSATTGLATGRWAFAATALSDKRVLVTGGAVRSGLAAADPDIDDLTATTEIFSAGSSS
jgi:N-acetylneuraminic acid mutarotase